MAGERYRELGLSYKCVREVERRPKIYVYIVKAHKALYQR